MFSNGLNFQMNFILLIIGLLIFFLNYEGLLATRYGKKNYEADEIRPRSVKNSPSFFVGPRYGKRMGWSPGDDEFSSPLPGRSVEDLNCDYTGISNYYRCSLRRDREEEDEDLSDSN